MVGPLRVVVAGFKSLFHKAWVYRVGYPWQGSHRHLEVTWDATSTNEPGADVDVAADLDELLEAGHPARFEGEFVDALDGDGWAGIGVDKDGDPMGAPAYHPRAVLGVWLYGFMTGVRSSRKLEAACRDQIPYLWLTGCQ